MNKVLEGESMVWSRSDVEVDKRYCLGLCQSEKRRRYYELREINSTDKSIDMIFMTKEVPFELLIERDIRSISEAVPLANGEKFYTNHGVWLTAFEFSQLSNVDFNQGGAEMIWETENPPKMPLR